MGAVTHSSVVTASMPLPVTPTSIGRSMARRSLRWRRVRCAHYPATHTPRCAAARPHAPLAQAALHLLVGGAPDEQVELADAVFSHLHLRRCASAAAQAAAALPSAAHARIGRALP
jgi:hypothetical protein